MSGRRRRAPRTVTFPHMGSVTIALRALFGRLEIPMVMAPPVSEETISLGVRHSPECACLPLKINVGNYLEAARLGAEAVVMIGGIGPCRLGYYAEVQREILRGLGVDLEMVVLEPPARGWRQLARQVGRLTGGRSWRDISGALWLAWHKMRWLDDLEALAGHLRPRECRRGLVSAALADGHRWLDEASTLPAIEEAGRAGRAALGAVEARVGFEPVRVAIVGEIFTVVEHSVNGACAEALGHLGAEVEQTVWPSEWVRNNLPLGPWRARGPGSEDHYRDLAVPYINHSVGGEGQPNVGRAVEAARRGFDGVVHLAPLTCMPEIVARVALDEVARDYGIPILTFWLDEHSSPTGLRTRLEAFVDLLERRRRGGGGPAPADADLVTVDGARPGRTSAAGGDGT